MSVPLARDGRSAPRRNVCVPAGRLLGLARVGCRRSQEHKRALFPAPDDAGGDSDDGCSGGCMRGFFCPERSSGSRGKSATRSDEQRCPTDRPDSNGAGSAAECFNNAPRFLQGGDDGAVQAGLFELVGMSPRAFEIMAELCVHLSALARVSECAAALPGCAVLGSIRSPVRGAKAGNREFLLVLEKTPADGAAAPSEPASEGPRP